MKKSVYAIVTERIISKIQEAIDTGEPLPWRKPWVYANSPRNYVTKKEYRGVNHLLLHEGEYLTWGQLCDLKKHSPKLALQKGCKSEIVVYFNFVDKVVERTTTAGVQKTEEQKIPYLRYYKVYRANDVVGLEIEPPPRFQHKPIVEAESIFQSYIQRENIPVTMIAGDKACYSPISDRLTLPLMEQFPNLLEYYSTVFHEAGHSTGHPKRLNRNIMNIFEDTSYSKEELVAEMTAAMLLGHCGVQTASTEQNSVSYMRSWLKALQDNVTLIVSASSQAQKAADYILGIIPSKENERA